MLEINYKVVVLIIKCWKDEFLEILLKLEDISCKKVEDLINSLENYDIEIYKIFEEIYFFLILGSKFNFFLGFDIVELYEIVFKKIKIKGYSGIYIVYDEFSKYLEVNINIVIVSDIKMF